MHLAAVDDVSESLDLERLLPESLLGESLLLVVAALQRVPQLLVVVHQILRHAQQLNHPKTVRALPPTHEGCLEVATVQILQTQVHTVHRALPELDILLPDHQSAVLSI